MDETKLTSTDQRIQAWYNVYDLCLSLGMDVTDKTGEQAVLDFIARIQELETADNGLVREYFEGFKVANQRLELILATAKETGLIDAKSVKKIMLMDAALLNNPPLDTCQESA